MLSRATRSALPTRIVQRQLSTTARCFAVNSFGDKVEVPRPGRSPNAPLEFPDLKSIRANPDLYARNAEIRNYGRHKDIPYQLVEKWNRVSEINEALKEPRKNIKQLEKQIARARYDRANGLAEKDDPESHARLIELRRRVQHFNDIVEKADAEKKELFDSSSALGLSLPNLTSSQTPLNGQPKVLRYIGYDPQNPPKPAADADHSAIGQELQILDFASGSASTGWGFYYLLNDAALLEQALVQYATQVAVNHGWIRVTPPSLVYSHMADSCGFQPRDANDEQQIWQIEQPGRDAGKPKRSLAATAEIPLAAMYASKTLDAAKLPIKYVGTSRCYRAEAGARGVDSKGLYRVHEFTKVEMFAWANVPLEDDLSTDETTKYSTEVFDEIVAIQTEILSSLGLPCRVLEMPSNDLGASAFRKIDIEAFFPSRISRDQGWGELTSVSICTDYQSRRLNTKIPKAPGAERGKFAHTINGTALAVPRVMACMLETHWDPEARSVTIPEVLRPYMQGKTKIGGST